MKKILSLILLIGWMIIIFLLSNVNGEESSNKSVGGIKSVVSTTYYVTDNIGITKDKANDIDNINELSLKLNYPVRKILHILEYFILTLLLFNAFYQFGIKDKRMIIFSLIICFLYACSDEIHQLFASRTCLFSDVLIDTLGGIIATIIIIFYQKYKKIN